MTQVELSTKPLLTIDEVQHIQQQRIVSVFAHVFRLAYAAMVDTPLVHEEKMSNCHGCAIQHPSQRQHSCLMMDGEDVWMYYCNVLCSLLTTTNVTSVIFFDNSTASLF